MPYQACLDVRLPGNPVANDAESIDKCVKELSSAIRKALRHLLLSVVPVLTTGPLDLPKLETKYALKFG
jgi:hypothetical protein